MADKSVLSNSLRIMLTLSGVAVMGALCFHLFVPSHSGIDPMTTASVHSENAASDQSDQSVELSPRDKTLIEAIDAFDDGDMETVIQARNEIDLHHVDRAILTWLIATSGRGDVPVSEIRKAQKELDGWPGQSIITRNLEIAMARDPLSLMRLRLSLDGEPPLSFQAAFALAKTYLVTGNRSKARALLVPYWHDKVLSRRDEARVLASFGEALTKRDHEIRFFNMMSRNRITAAGRLVETLGYERVHDAWAAVIRRQKSALSKMGKLTEDEKKLSAYYFMRTEFLRRADRDDDAIKILSALPSDPAFLINPDAWWDERRIISRHKFEAGDAKTAYELVAAHKGGSDATRVDAAFHAGWYALRGLNQPDVALEHFKAITEIAKGDISQARGYYWMGRALGETQEALDAFTQAAEFDTTYYGWLAREELGRTETAGLFPDDSMKQDSPISGDLLAAKRLFLLDQKARARALYTAIGRSGNIPGQIKKAALQASTHGDHFAALRIAKAADWRGIEMGTLTHPLGAISNATGIAPIDHALAYAIARQESEFNVAAVSSANAKGLMQVLPGTAREMARRIGEKYEPRKLTTDANYNARLGVAYLHQQFEKFDGSYVLTFAAYNAGPTRAREWVARFGDPRGKPLHEVIDWVEMIPFPETRSYVQRILENLQVYKVKLGQEASIVSDLRFGNARAF